jgi:hypothetical protein
MTDDFSRRYANETVREILEEGLSQVESPPAQPTVPPKQLLNYGRRRHFALGLVLVAIFLLLLALVLPREDLFLWGGYSALLIIVGAWQWDKAKKELTVRSDAETQPTGDGTVVTLRSIDGNAP